VARLKEKLKHIICTASAKNNLKDVKGTESKCPYVQIKLLEYLSKLTIKYYPNLITRPPGLKSVLFEDSETVSQSHSTIKLANLIKANSHTIKAEVTTTK
jgi:hypothetical protein